MEEEIRHLATQCAGLLRDLNHLLLASNGEVKDEVLLFTWRELGRGRDACTALAQPALCSQAGPWQERIREVYGLDEPGDEPS